MGSTKRLGEEVKWWDEMRVGNSGFMGCRLGLAYWICLGMDRSGQVYDILYIDFYFKDRFCNYILNICLRGCFDKSLRRFCGSTIGWVANLQTRISRHSLISNHRRHSRFCTASAWKCDERATSRWTTITRTENMFLWPTYCQQTCRQDHSSVVSWRRRICDMGLHCPDLRYLPY